MDCWCTKCPRDEIVHTCIKHNNHKLLRWFLKSAETAFGMSSLSSCVNVRTEHTKSHILGTAVLANNFTAVRMIVETEKLCDSLWNSLECSNVDDFVYGNNTAIQAAFMRCPTNFELLKYLLSHHSPYYAKCNQWTQYLDKCDSYLIDKIVLCNAYIRLHVTIDPSSIASIVAQYYGDHWITHKRDSQGFTLDDRINQSVVKQYLAPNECAELARIIEQARQNSPFDEL